MKAQLPEEALPRLVAYYDLARKDFWIPDRRGDWITVSESALRRHLKASGISPECRRNDLVSELDAALNDIQLDCSVAYAGPLAGYRKGMIESNGNRILVTSSPRLIEPKKGDFPLIAKLLENLFMDAVCDQRPYVFGWLKVGLESLRSGSFRPGQAIAYAGPHDSGKSIWQNLKTEILGGRSAKPYRYMSGQSPFNRELFGAEHLMIEDDFASTDLRARREFGAKIKEFTVNRVQSCHGKGREAVNMIPFWRLSVSLNGEPENLMILPPMDDSIEDKIILLRANAKPMPMDTSTADGYAAFWKALVDELPAFVHYLLAWEIPEELRSRRFGITHWHHPDLLDAIDALSPEVRLLSLIDSVLFGQAAIVGDPITITAEELEQRLVNSNMGYESRRLLSWNNACGTYLGRLAKKFPERVSKDRTNQSRGWILTNLQLAEGQ